MFIYMVTNHDLLPFIESYADHEVDQGFKTTVLYTMYIKRIIEFKVQYI